MSANVRPRSRLTKPKHLGSLALVAFIIGFALISILPSGGFAKDDEDDPGGSSDPAEPTAIATKQPSGGKPPIVIDIPTSTPKPPIVIDIATATPKPPILIPTATPKPPIVVIPTATPKPPILIPTATPVVIDIDPDDPIVIPTATEVPQIDLDGVPPLVELEPVSVTVHKYVCFGGAELYAAGRDALQAACQDAGANTPFEFDLLSQPTPGDNNWLSATTDSDGLAFFVGAKAGKQTIYETVPPSYGSPVAFCVVNPPLGGDPFYSGAQVIDGHAAIELASGDTLYCEWYNIPILGDGEIVVNKHRCPDLFDAYNATLADLEATCIEPMNGVVFSVGDGSGILASTLTGWDEESAAIFTDLPAGTFSIIEQVPENFGEPIVFCDGGFPMGVSNGTQITHELGDNDEVVCEWYNVPLNVPGGHTGGDDESTVTIIKSNCPADFDAYNADFMTLITSCQDPMVPVSFYLTNGAIDVTVATGQGSNTAAFPGLGIGEYFISEQIPSGYGTPIVFCAEPQPGDGELDGYVPVQVEAGNQIFYLITEPLQVYCQWFNVPTEVEETDTVSVFIDKHGCPTELDAYGADLATLTTVCVLPMDGVPFTLVDGAGIAMPQATGDLAPSMVIWDIAAPGTISVTESIPDGYGLPLVFCEVYSAGDPAGSTSLEPIAVGDDTISLDLLPGDLLYCDWYNVPVIYVDQGNPEDPTDPGTPDVPEGQTTPDGPIVVQLPNTGSGGGSSQTAYRRDL